ncbi:hypothetical protein F5Y18DRAFT_421264 [Xylariaceae sp. FL1019]|nr:hypothetical protein F5Y18DRAFT_421264 [Xylariaceae sp. FL1019]
MGFTTGFTGGVTLTLGVAYLTVLAHRRHREHQAAVLRQQTILLDGIVYNSLPLSQTTRAEQALLNRGHVVDTAKDRWNSEIHHAVSWAQDKDWDAVREGVETAVGRLWARAFSNARAAAETAEEEVLSAARHLSTETKQSARGKANDVDAAARSAYADAKAKSAAVSTRAESTAEEAKETVISAVEMGIKKGKEVLAKAKSAVVGAEERVQSEIESKLNPVERTLQRRYEKGDNLDKSVDEVLAARYVPTDLKDETELRGL